MLIAEARFNVARGLGRRASDKALPSFPPDKPSAVCPRLFSWAGGATKAWCRLLAGVLLRYCSGITLMWIGIHVRVIPEQYRSNKLVGSQ